MKPPDELWLTRITLTGTDVGLAANASAMHRRVMALFPDGLGDQARRTAGVLYRVEPVDGSALRLLVQSHIRPDPDAYGGARTVSLLPLLDHLSRGRAVHYRIAANPIKASRENTEWSARGKRKALYGVEAEQWWQGKAAAAGLAATIVTAKRHDLASDGRARKSGAKRVFNSGVCFDGVATVTDPQLLTGAITDGIGRGRSYGLGLLSLAPMGG